MSFDRARTVADAVLLEGYVLYPYRASSTKNRFRWVFGVLAPHAWSVAGGGDPWMLELDCLVEGTRHTRLQGKLRFLQVCRRQVHLPDGTPVESLDVDGRLLVSFEEGEVREIELGDELVALSGEPRPFELPGSEAEERVLDASGALQARIIRRSLPLAGTVAVLVEPVAELPLFRLRIRVENRTPWEDLHARRQAVMPASMAAAHLLAEVAGGGFVSMIDPPPWTASHAAACRSTGVYPVLAGAPGDRSLLLASPIVLYDHPQIAPESPGDFFDATEIDELLVLRTATLSEEEKREVRATDNRAAAILDRSEQIPPELMSRLHGAARALSSGEMVPRAPPPGTRVRLCPGVRRTDAQDLLYAGCIARVEKVMRDVEDRDWVAVTIEGDPAAELHRWYGRFHYYGVDEIEPLEAVP